LPPPGLPYAQPLIRKNAAGLGPRASNGRAAQNGSTHLGIGSIWRSRRSNIEKRPRRRLVTAQLLN
jgi:hypothetical protein